MIIVIPPTLYGRAGAVLSALIIVFTAIGLTMHKDVYDRVPRRDFYCYYTNLSNLLVLLYFALAAPLLYARGALRRLIPSVEFAVTAAITLTHVVFHFLLFPDIRRALAKASPSRELSILRADNFIIHYLVPWLVLVYWVFCAPGKRALGLRDVFLWLVLPYGYLAAVFWRARSRRNIVGTDSPFPYPFLDVHRRGAGAVAGTCLSLTLRCMLLSASVIAVVHLLFRLFGGQHALLLI